MARGIYGKLIRVAATTGSSLFRFISVFVLQLITFYYHPVLKHVLSVGDRRRNLLVALAHGSYLYGSRFFCFCLAFTILLPFLMVIKYSYFR